MEPSDAVTARVHKRFARLEHLHDRITSCEVTIDAPPKHQHKGALFEIRIRLLVPDSELLVNRDGPEDQAHTDVYVALRDAFDALERKLEAYLRQRGHRQKVHEGRSEDAAR